MLQSQGNRGKKLERVGYKSPIQSANEQPVKEAISNTISELAQRDDIKSTPSKTGVWDGASAMPSQPTLLSRNSDLPLVGDNKISIEYTTPVTRQSSRQNHDLLAAVAALPTLKKEIPPLSTPLAPLSTENIKKLNDKHKDHFRMMDIEHEHTSDGENEADDEGSIGREAETLTDCYDTSNPRIAHAPNNSEVEDLEDQFKDIKIKKRTRSELEESQNEEKIDLDVRNSGSADNNQKQTKEDRDKRSKKIRVAAPSTKDKASGSNIA